MSILSSSLLALCLIAAAMAKPTEDNVALQAVSQGASQFSSGFFQGLIAQEKGNLISSPLSAAVVLSMAAYGARGETEREMRSVLHIPSDDNLGKSGFQALMDIFNNVKDVELRMANKVFTAKGFTVKQDFKQLTETFFRSATQGVNFGNSVEAAQTINSWVENQTNNRIKNLINPGDVDPLTAMILVNALYFKGQWKTKFNPQFTVDKPFHVDANTVTNVPTMYSNANYKYGELPELKAKFIELPYKGNEFSMVILLPDEQEGLAEMERKLQNMNMSEILKQGFEREVHLFLPKFKIESKFELGDVLEKMGLRNMFTDAADFTGIADEMLKVSKVVQKAFIEVNEEGSEAAAATGVIMALCCAYVPEIEINRPFLYSIVRVTGDKFQSNLTATPIFQGRVIKPQA